MVKIVTVEEMQAIKVAAEWEQGSGRSRQKDFRFLALHQAL
jgi:hypothetical protein